MSCFLILLKLNGQLLKKHTRLQRIKIKQINQYSNLEVSHNDQRSIFLLKKNGFKMVSRQEKIIFTKICFNYTSLVKRNPIKLYFMFPLEVPKKPIWFVYILTPLKSNMFNKTRIVVYSVAWYVICLIPSNMLQNRLLSRNFNHI